MIMMNITDQFIYNYENNIKTSIEIKQKLQENILKICGLTNIINYPMRELQLLSIIYFMRKKQDIFCVLPTGYGKTLIAICNALYMWRIYHKKTIFVGIYKALTSEQFDTFNEMGIKSIILDGDHKKNSNSYENEDWVICCLTPEKLDSIICNKEKRPILMNDVGLIVTDEVQNIGEENRGHNMENYIAICRSQYENLRFNYLSATIGNPEELSKDTDSKLILALPKDRPVPLKTSYHNYEEIVYSWDETIPDFNANHQQKLEILSEIIKEDEDSTFLIFVTSRQRCKTIAKYLCGTSYIPSLETMIEQYGIAFHNADLTYSERKYVEKSFKNSVCNIIICTPTLAAGVNLPADHSIIFDVEQYNTLRGSEVIGANRIQQSIGRAGRPGLSEYGYAHIIVCNRLFDEVKYRVEHPAIIKSQLYHRLHEKVLKWIAGGICNVIIDGIEIVNYTFAKITKEDIIDAIDWLKTFNFIKESKNNTLYVTTTGKLTNQMYIMPETVVYWTSQIKSISDINNMKELYSRFGSTNEYMGVVTVRTDDSKIINYSKLELGKRFYDNKVLNQNLCFCCEFQFECKIKQYKTSECKKFYNNMLEIIPNRLLKSYFLTFYDDLAEKYLPKKYNRYTKKMEVKGLPISFGDKYQLKNAGERMFTAASVIFYMHEDLSQNLKILSSMCYAGTLQQDLVELCKIKGIGIKKAKKLVHSGIKTIKQFISVDSKQIAKALGCAIRVAKELQESC